MQLAILKYHIYIEFQTALNLAKNRVPQPQLSSFTRTDHPINKITEDRIIKVHENLDYTKLYEELHKFKERHYSARIIKLVIQVILLKIRQTINYFYNIQFIYFKNKLKIYNMIHLL